MMTLKKIILGIAALLLFDNLIASQLHKKIAQTNDTHELPEWLKNTDDSVFYTEEVQKLTLYTPEEAIYFLTRACDPDIPEETVIEAQNILKEDIYKHTGGINDRNFPIDYPGSYFLICQPERWEPYISFFYNQTTKANFTKDGTTLRSYLAFDNLNLINQIDELAFGVNVVKLLSLLGNIKIQERRAAILFGGAGWKNRWLFNVRTPLVYLERNFHLTPEERRALESENIFNNPGQEELTEFARKHLISDKFGLGDTRFNAGYLAIDEPFSQLFIGFESTLPTAFPFAKGLIGNHFEKNNVVPPFDLIEILNLVAETPVQNPQQAQVLIEQFLLAALDKLSSNLLESDLGNSGHIGVGLFTDSTLAVTSKLQFRARSTLEYLLPALEKRFYIKKKNPADFDRFNPPNPDNCQADLIFLQQQLINTLFPSVFNTVVFPGFIFKFSTALIGQMSPHWNLMLGYDLWWQQQEKLGKISAPPGERAQLRTDIAVRSSALQNKIFGSINYAKEGDKHDWCLSFYGDRTFIRSGIGRDFTMAFRFALLF